MISASTRCITLAAILLIAMPAYAAGSEHPLSGIDHMTAMIAVGLWAALKGGKAIWAWPLVFVGLMVAGGGLGILHVPVTFIEPGILASMVALGVLVALTVDLQVSVGVAFIGLPSLFPGHGHGTEVPKNVGAIR